MAIQVYGARVPIPASISRPLAKMPRWLLYVLPAVMGLAAGLAWGLLKDDPHAATAERLVGTVTWSNVDTRQIVFEADGEERDPLAGDTIYQITGQWEDPASTTFGEGFPPAWPVPKGIRSAWTIAASNLMPSTSITVASSRQTSQSSSAAPHEPADSEAPGSSVG